MKVFNAEQVRRADQFTIDHEPIASIDLMERASKTCFRYLRESYSKEKSFAVYCGFGNNGGDGLAIARMLRQAGYEVKVFLLVSENYSEDCNVNLDRFNKLQRTEEAIKLTSVEQIVDADVVLDCLFGSGLTRPLAGNLKHFVQEINALKGAKVSVDIPSGLFMEDNSENDIEAIIKADMVLSFEFPKLSFFLADNEAYVKDWKILPIGLDSSFTINENTNYEYLLEEDIKSLYNPRKRFSHKGTYGHGLLIAGAKGKMGAATLASLAALRSGIGLLSTYVPDEERHVLQVSVPEAVVETDETLDWSDFELGKAPYRAVAIGPGIGTKSDGKAVLEKLLSHTKSPVILDADALNLLAENPVLWKEIPRNSILTPHPKEFDRLAGVSNSAFERIQKQRELSEKHGVIVVLKGANTSISTDKGEIVFNSTGNPGMAKGGSGDVLTGVILGLMCQGYSSLSSCKLGVWMHGKSADLVVEDKGVEALLASEIANGLGKVYKLLHK